MELSRSFGAVQPVQIMGSGQSWSDVAATEPKGKSVVLGSLNGIKIHKSRMVVKAGAGATFHDVYEALRTKGLTLAWMPGSILAPSVGGAVSVGFHGSRPARGSLSTVVERLALAETELEMR